MEIKYTEKAFKQLNNIMKGDKKSAKNIVLKIEAYSKNSNGNYDIKMLKGEFKNLYRLRVGDYRVIFSIEDSGMIVALIKHRQGAYYD